MYDPLYDRIPAFERATGLTVEIVDRLPHPELNAQVRRDFEAGAPDLDLISTHTKYAPSQAAWLSALDASESRPANAPSTATSRNVGGADRPSATRFEIAGFCEAIRVGKPLACGPERALHSARACILANDAIGRKAPLTT